MSIESELTYIDLFAGCGGLSLGLHNAGWKGLFAIEKSPLAFKTLEYNLIKKLNHFNWPTWLPITNHNINSILKNNKEELINLRGKVGLVAGGPPCQGFSTAGHRKESDNRNTLIKSYVKFIKLVQPKVIFFENVSGFTMEFSQNKTKGKRYSDYVKGALKNLNYNVEGKVIDFSEYGIPQKRNRFILVGIRKDVADNKKASLFFDSIKAKRKEFLIAKDLTINTKLNQAISDLLMSNGTIDSQDSKGFLAGTYSNPKTKYQKFMRHNNENIIPDSHRFTNHKVETTKLFTEILNNAIKNKRIDGDARLKYGIKKRSITLLGKSFPSPVLTSHPDDYIHYSEPRILTVREYARIQSFPDWYEIKGKYTTGGKERVNEVPRYTQLGNAIPPLFGEQAGLALISLFNNG